MPAVPPPHLTYAQLLGHVPDPLAATFVPDLDTLKSLRDAQCPDMRAEEWCVSGAGDDVAGDGSEEAPWASVVPVNALASPPRGVNTNGAAGWTGPAGTNYTSSTGWTFCGWVRVDGNGSGALLDIPGAFGLGGGKFRAGVGHDSTPYVYTAGGASELIFDSAALSAGMTAPAFVVGSVSNAGAAKVSVNRHTVTGTITAPGTVGSSSLVNSYFMAGDMGRFGVFRGVLSDATLDAMYARGPRMRRFELKRYFATEWANCLSWWDGDDAGDSSNTRGARSLADAKGVGPLATTSGAQGMSLGGDAAITAAPTSGPQGGADLRVSWMRQVDAYRSPTPFTANRSGMTFGDYGDPDLPTPVISLFSLQYGVGGWTQHSGNCYKRASADPAWVKRRGDDRPPFQAPLRQAQTLAECVANGPNAGTSCYYYDNATGSLTLGVEGQDGGRFFWDGTFLYLNVGGAPDAGGTVWEAVPWSGTGPFAGGPPPGGNPYRESVSPTAMADNLRVENLIFLGGGLSRPGTFSGYGLQVSMPAAVGTLAEVFVKGCGFYYTGYHALGILASANTDCSAYTVRCSAGYCTDRNQGGVTGTADPDTITHYVVVGDGNTEWMFADCESYGGVLPAWTGRAPGGVGGDAAFHHGRDSTQRLGVYLRHRITATAHGRAQRPPAAGAILNAAASAPADCRVFVVGTTTNRPEKYHLAAVYQNGCAVNCADYGPRETEANEYAYSFGDATGDAFLVNCSPAYTLAAQANTVLSGNGTGLHLHYLGCHLKVDAPGSAFVVAPSGITVTFTSTILDIAATSASSGPGTDTYSYCAFRTLSATGTGAVTLAARPAFPVRPDGRSQLAGAGTATGTPAYDAAGGTRPSPRAIGPLDLGGPPWDTGEDSDVPTAAEIAAAVRANLATELARIDVATSTRSTYAGADTAGTTTLLTRVTGAVALASDLATVAGYVDTEVAAIKAKTDLIPAGGPLAASAYTAPPSAVTVASAVLGATVPADAAGTPTTLQAILRRLFSRAGHKQTRNRESGDRTLYAADGTTPLEVRTQSTSGDTDTLSAAG